MFTVFCFVLNDIQVPVREQHTGGSPVPSQKAGQPTQVGAEVGGQNGGIRSGVNRTELNPDSVLYSF
jgi:hypothetical protein